MITIVSVGDSWFQHPCWLRDIIDKIRDDYAVLSLGAAGDTMSEMLESVEYMHHLEKENAHVLLFSGGGNDVLGNGHLESMLHQYDPSNPGRKPEDYLNDESDKVFKDIDKNYRLLINQVSGISHRVDIFIHGYDYLIPNDGKYLGKPMVGIGIMDLELQKAIVRVLIDKFNLILKSLSAGKEKVHYINCRGSVDPSEWDDEIHPTSRGFEGVAKRFKDELRKIPPPSDSS